MRHFGTFWDAECAGARLAIAEEMLSHGFTPMTRINPHTASTTTGGAARQGCQWRIYFFANRLGTSELRKKNFI
jgi:hypothetical protein